MSDKKILLIEQKPVPRRVVQMMALRDGGNEEMIVVLADDGTLWSLPPYYDGWYQIKSLPDRTVEELRDG